MIRIFRALNPLNILWLAVVLIVLRLGYLLNAPDKVGFTFTGPFNRLALFASWQYSVTPFLSVTLAAALVFAQALLLNQLVNQYNLLGKPSFLPALMYVTVSGLFTPFLVLSAPLVCNFLVIAMLHKLFSFYKSSEAKSPAFDLGMIVAAGTLIYLPFIYLFLGIWAALILFRPFNWREPAAAIFGFITIFFFLAVYYYLNDSLGQFYNIWLPLGTKFPVKINIRYYDYLVLVPVIIIFVLYFVKLRENFFKSYVQVRKSFQLLLIMFLIAGLSFYVNDPFNLNHFLLCAIPAAIFFSYYFLNARVKWFCESLFYLLLISIVYFQFNNF